jgi:hypothetical protein
LHTSSFFTADAVFTSFEQVRLSRHSRKSVSRGAVISKLHYRSLALQPVDLFALLTDRTQLSLCPQGLLLPGFHQDGHPNLMLDIATVPTGQFTRTGLPPVGLAASFAALKLLLPPRQSRGFSQSNRREWLPRCSRRAISTTPENGTMFLEATRPPAAARCRQGPKSLSS